MTRKADASGPRHGAGGEKQLSAISDYVEQTTETGPRCKRRQHKCR
jgi:hypothetical protein